MPEETPQLPVSEQEVQIEAPSFVDKLKLQKKKILIGLGVFFGVLALVGVVFGAYLIGQRSIYPEPVEGPTTTPEAPTPTPDPTADWETYTNTEYGYLIKHPPEMNEPEAESMVKVRVLSEQYQTIISRLESEWWGGTSQSPNKAENIVVAGIDAKKISGAQVATGYGLFEVYFPKEESTFKIALYVGPDEKELGYSEDTFSLILSTFEFLEEGTALPSPTAPTGVINYEYIEGWPLYADSGMGFSFQYPPSYSSPKKATADPGVEGEPFCEFLSTRNPAGAQNVESIRVLVVPYESGSRRELLMKRLALFDKDILSVQEIEFAPVKGLLIEFKPQYPIWEKYFTSILIQGSTALIIGNLQVDLNEDEWNNLLKSFQIKDLHLDLSKCESDWD